MNTYEVFTTEFSQVIQADSISEAMGKFDAEHSLEIICIENVAYRPTPTHGRTADQPQQVREEVSAEDKITGKDIVEQIFPYIDEKFTSTELNRLYRCIDSALEKARNQAIESIKTLFPISTPTIQASQSHPVNTGDGWVKVEDGLPEDNFERYICCLKNKLIIEMNFTRLDNITQWSSIGLGHENKDNPVTHWQPLPLPPVQ